MTVSKCFTSYFSLLAKVSNIKNYMHTYLLIYNSERQEKKQRPCNKEQTNHLMLLLLLVFIFYCIFSNNNYTQLINFYAVCGYYVNLNILLCET